MGPLAASGPARRPPAGPGPRRHPLFRLAWVVPAAGDIFRRRPPQAQRSPDMCRRRQPECRGHPAGSDTVETGSTSSATWRS